MAYKRRKYTRKRRRGWYRTARRWVGYAGKLQRAYNLASYAAGALNVEYKRLITSASCNISFDGLKYADRNKGKLMTMSEGTDVEERTGNQVKVKRVVVQGYVQGIDNNPHTTKVLLVIGRRGDGYLPCNTNSTGDGVDNNLFQSDGAGFSPGTLGAPLAFLSREKKRYWKVLKQQVFNTSDDVHRRSFYWNIPMNMHVDYGTVVDTFCETNQLYMLAINDTDRTNVDTQGTVLAFNACVWYVDN